MLAKRIIPCLDVKDGRVVKGVHFVGLRDAGDPVAQAKIYDAAGADELVFLDISATPDGRATVAPMVRARLPTKFFCRSPSAAASARWMICETFCWRARIR